MQRMSGWMSHCSDANNVPVRPKPVATSSAITSTPAACAASTTRRDLIRVGHLDAGGALHQRLEHDRGQLVGRAAR